MVVRREHGDASSSRRESGRRGRRHGEEDIVSIGSGREVTSALLAALLVGATKLLVTIDAKMMAGFGREDGSVAKLVRFEAPAAT